jgi:hypothetical protein
MMENKFHHDFGKKSMLGLIIGVFSFKNWPTIVKTCEFFFP